MVRYLYTNFGQIASYAVARSAQLSEKCILISDNLKTGAAVQGNVHGR